jgi:threonine dehydratase
MKVLRGTGGGALSLELTGDDIQRARTAIAGLVHRTALFSSQSLTRRTGRQVFLKAENLQKTGSFKARGAFNKVCRLSAEERIRGVITASTGNHGQAVAFAAAQQGVPACVVMPEAANPSKAEAILAYGAECINHGELWDDSNEYAIELAGCKGLTYIHPLRDRYIMAGQSTIVLEILEDLPEVEAVLAPIGGGGLIAGMAMALRRYKPEVKIIGVEPEGAATMFTSRRQGRPIDLDTVTTIADGLATRNTDPLLFEIVEKHVDDLVTVTDEGILDAVRFLLERAKLLAEPAGALTVAALLENKVSLRPGTRTVALISGGNFDIKGRLEFRYGREGR